ncbi:XRE family transcriptional regulator [Pseudomonas nitroreducens]|uniref:helix-turn-helix domain-containing protein n=1 Tax=Pseudomonas nitroreducens TaxID=46680 RepID=UPI0023F8EA19|nr:XRE family transcriptional regulator [Pseudomonas nitroreducens]WEW98508.1 XRE family transcriptional regulator [Pseudomonas nitroreducens]
MIKERVITILAWSDIKLPKLEELTGISRYTWSNLKNPSKSREIKEEEILAIAKVFPQFRWWLLTGEVLPEIGQISPDYEGLGQNLAE